RRAACSNGCGRSWPAWSADNPHGMTGNALFRGNSNHYHFFHRFPGEHSAAAGCRLLLLGKPLEEPADDRPLRTNVMHESGSSRAPIPGQERSEDAAVLACHPSDHVGLRGCESEEGFVEDAVALEEVADVAVARLLDDVPVQVVVQALG